MIQNFVNLPSPVVVVIVTVAVAASAQTSTSLLAAVSMLSSIVSIPSTVWAQEVLDLVLSLFDVSTERASRRGVSRARRVTITASRALAFMSGSSGIR